MPGIRRFSKSIRKLDNVKEDTIIEFQGVLGVSIKGQKYVDVPNRDGYVYVRLRSNLSEVIQAYNSTVSPVYDLPVLVKRDKTYERFVVSGRDLGRYGDWGSSSYLPRHGAQHSFSDAHYGGDIVWVYDRQFVPCSIAPSGVLGANDVIVNGDVIYWDGTWKYVGNTGTPDMFAYKPTGSSARMVLVYIDDHGNPELLEGDTFADTSLTGISQLIPYLPDLSTSAGIPIGAVRLLSGTSRIVWPDIYDLRPLLSQATWVTPYQVEDEGTPLTRRKYLNFKGATVWAVDNAGDDSTDIIISGSAGGGGGSGSSVSVTGTPYYIPRFDATGNDIEDSSVRTSGSDIHFGAANLYLGTGSDVTLYRYQENVLMTDDNFYALGYLLTSDSIYICNEGDKLYFGDSSGSYDTNLYRWTNNWLRTDDSLYVGGTLVTESDIYMKGAAICFGTGSDVVLYRLTEHKLALDDSFVIVTGSLYLSASPYIYFGTGSDVNLYRAQDNMLKTDDEFVAGNNLWALTDIYACHEIFLPSDSGKIYFGTGSDVNLYRVATNTLRTDDQFIAQLGLVAGLDGVYLYTAGTMLYFGDSAGGYDTNLYRGGSNLLKTDDRFAGQPAINNDEFVTKAQISGSYGSTGGVTGTPGYLAKFDATGNDIEDSMLQQESSTILSLVTGSFYLRQSKNYIYFGTGSDVSLYRSGDELLRTNSRFAGLSAVNSDEFVTLSQMAGISGTPYRFAKFDATGNDIDNAYIIDPVSGRTTVLRGLTVSGTVVGNPATASNEYVTKAQISGSYGSEGVTGTPYYIPKFDATGNDLANSPIRTSGSDVHFGAARLYLGTGSDVNLYRSNEGHLRTDDGLEIVTGTSLFIRQNTAADAGIFFGTGSDVYLGRLGDDWFYTPNNIDIAKTLFYGHLVHGNVTGTIVVPLLSYWTSDRWEGSGHSTGGPYTIDVSARFDGAPADTSSIKGYQVQIGAQDSAAWGTSGLSVYVGNPTNNYLLVARPAGGDVRTDSFGIVACDANGDLVYRVAASGPNTLDVWIRISAILV